MQYPCLYFIRIVFGFQAIVQCHMQCNWEQVLLPIAFPLPFSPQGQIIVMGKHDIPATDILPGMRGGIWILYSNCTCSVLYQLWLEKTFIASYKAPAKSVQCPT